RHHLFQRRNLAQQCKHQRLQLGRREIIKIARRRHAATESQLCRDGNRSPARQVDLPRPSACPAFCSFFFYKPLKTRLFSDAIPWVRTLPSPPPKYLILQIFSPRRPGFEIPRHLRGFAAMPIRRAVGETAFKRL